MIYAAIIVIILSILGLIFIYILGTKEKLSTGEIMFPTSILTILLSGWLIVLTTPKEKSHLEYLRGNLEVKYEYTYRDSVLVKTDTIIEFKKKKL